MSRKLVIWEIVAGLLLAYWLITRFFSGSANFEDLALGTETVPYQAVDTNNRLIHIQRINGEQDREFVEGWLNRGEKSVILFFGNSQTHSINQRKEGEVNYIELLYKKKPESITSDIMCESLPNAGLQEFYLAYQYWKDKLPLKTVVVPVFMDDLREDGIRDVFFPDLIRQRFQLPDTSDFLAIKINANLRANWSSNPNSKSESKKELEVLHETLQEKSEAYLNERLAENSSAWVNRANVRGELFNSLYKLRNTAFRINANTIRKMIPYRYNLNMHALDLLVKDCLKSDRKILIYIPPIRSDVDLPYDKIEYSRFKEELKDFETSYPGNVFYRDFDNLVPGELWGYKAATSFTSKKEIDFMHFQGKGHQLLADSLMMELIRINKQ